MILIACWQSSIKCEINPWKVCQSQNKYSSRNISFKNSMRSSQPARVTSTRAWCIAKMISSTKQYLNWALNFNLWRQRNFLCIQEMSNSTDCLPSERTAKELSKWTCMSVLQWSESDTQAGCEKEPTYNAVHSVVIKEWEPRKPCPSAIHQMANNRLTSWIADDAWFWTHRSGAPYGTGTR
jgi:hypothetical protein